MYDLCFFHYSVSNEFIETDEKVSHSKRWDVRISVCLERSLKWLNYWKYLVLSLIFICNHWKPPHFLTRWDVYFHFYYPTGYNSCWALITVVWPIFWKISLRSTLNMIDAANIFLKLRLGPWRASYRALNRSWHKSLVEFLGFCWTTYTLYVNSSIFQQIWYMLQIKIIYIDIYMIYMELFN